MLLYRIADPGPGSRSMSSARGDRPSVRRSRSRICTCGRTKGIRPGGFGLMMVRASVDELIYNEKHNEVVFVKYLESAPGGSGHCPLFYSERSAWMTSTREARAAGISDARTAAATRTTAAPAIGIAPGMRTSWT